MDALLDMAGFQPFGGESAALAPLLASPVRDTAARFLAKAPAWIDTNQDNALYWALLAVAPRRDPALVEITRALQERWQGKLEARAALAARLMCGDPDAITELQSAAWLDNKRDLDKIVEVLIWSCPPAAAEILIPIVRRYQHGATHLAPLAKAVSTLGAAKTSWKGGQATHTPAPLDPAWFDLGLEILLERPRPGVRPGVMLAAPSSNRETRVREALARAPNSQTLAALLPPRPLPKALSPEQQGFVRHTDFGYQIALHGLDPARLDGILAALDEPPARIQLAFPAKLTATERKQWFAAAGMARASRHKLIALGAAGFKAYLKSPHVAGVTHLVLREADIGLGGVTELAASDAMPALAHLDLGTGDHDRTTWTDDVAAALVAGRGASLAGLASLRLDGWKIRNGGPLGESALFRGLTELSMRRQMQLGLAAHALLFGLGEGGSQLAKLDLGTCYRNLRDGSGNWTESRGQPIKPVPIRTLVFDGNIVDAKLLEAISKAGWPLETLILKNTDPRALDGLKASNLELRHLDLADSPTLTAAHVREWSTWPVFAKLDTLVLTGQNEIRGDDLATFPEAVQRAIVAGGWPG